MSRGGTFPRECVARLKRRKHLTPKMGNVLCFTIFFVAGLRFPLDPAVPEILARFKVKIHQLTPNAIVQLSKFFWAVKTFWGPISVDAFCHLYELHP